MTIIVPSVLAPFEILEGHSGPISVWSHIAPNIRKKLKIQTILIFSEESMTTK